MTLSEEVNEYLDNEVKIAKENGVGWDWQSCMRVYSRVFTKIIKRVDELERKVNEYEQNKG